MGYCTAKNWQVKQYPLEKQSRRTQPKEDVHQTGGWNTQRQRQPSGCFCAPPFVKVSTGVAEIQVPMQQSQDSHP